MRAAGSKLKHRCDAANALSSDDRWSVADMLKGELQAVCGVADASRRVAELQLLNERKDRFIAILAHELRRPVAPIANTSGSSGGGKRRFSAGHRRLRTVRGSTVRLPRCFSVVCGRQPSQCSPP